MDQENEIAVAKQLQATAASINAQFIVNVGDNFYYYGVESTTDLRWNNTFESVFTLPSSMVKWYSVLGNHDYGKRSLY